MPVFSSLFRKRVLSAVRRIPKGMVTTYAKIAARAGNPRAYRAVGTILKSNEDQKTPCHRVIRSDKTIGEYNGLKGRKVELLRREGVTVTASGKVL